jgi:hypothetical protein
MNSVCDIGTRRRTATIVGVVILAVCATFAMTLGSTADAKKKKKAPTVFQQLVQPNAAIPDDQASGPSIPLDSSITVGKKFKGKLVGDVNVTSIQTTGSGPGAASDLNMRIIAPSGRAVRLVGFGIGDVNIGPLTFDDDTIVSICDATNPPCSYGPDTLNRPFAGTSNLQFMGGAGTAPLSHLDGLPMRGTWTFQIWDEDDTTTNTLNSWGLQIAVKKPVK